MDTNAAIDEDEREDYQHDATKLKDDGLHNLCSNSIALYTAIL